MLSHNWSGNAKWPKFKIQFRSDCEISKLNVKRKTNLDWLGIRLTVANLLKPVQNFTFRLNRSGAGPSHARLFIFYWKKWWKKKSLQNFFPNLDSFKTNVHMIFHGIVSSHALKTTKLILICIKYHQPYDFLLPDGAETIYSLLLIDAVCGFKKKTDIGILCICMNNVKYIYVYCLCGRMTSSICQPRPASPVSFTTQCRYLYTEIGKSRTLNRATL